MVKKKAGRGAVASVMAKMLHPKRAIINKYPNTWERERITGLSVIAKLNRQSGRRGKMVPSYQFQHDDFEGIELFAATRMTTITEEGPPEHFFDAISAPPANHPPEEEENGDEDHRGSTENVAPTVSHSTRITLEDVQDLRAQGVFIDDDNEAAPENIPEEGEPTITISGSTWHWDFPTVDPRKAQSHVCSCKAPATGIHQPQLEFRRSLAIQMLENNLDDDGNEVDVPSH